MEKDLSTAIAARPAPHANARRIAATNCSLLISGETGTGKGYLARWIHDHSARRNGPFVPVNCGAIPESLIDSHLFGHAKGAFSGAESDHPGLLRAANGGTILFDEISELPLAAQTRLLRLLEDREVQPVGYSRPVKIDVRIMAATNRDLAAAVRGGTLREDLYFRLDVVRLGLRPLRERTDEIPALLDQFNVELAEVYQQPELRFGFDAMRMLEQYAWPGNVRELRTVVERLHVLRGEREQAVSVDDLCSFGQVALSEVALAPRRVERMQELKLEAVEAVLESCQGNMSRAALRLGVHRSTLYRWLAQPVAA